MAEDLAGKYPESPSVIKRTHARHEGLHVCPTSGGAAEVIQLHDPYEVENVDFTCSQWGGPPLVPAFNPPDANHIFLTGGRSTNSPPFSGINGRHWQISGTYTYFIISPVGLASDFKSARIGNDPTMTDANDATIPGTTCFAVGLLG